MLCASCRRQLDRGAELLRGCGAPQAGHSAPLELVLGDRTRVAVVTEMTIGRAPELDAAHRRPHRLARARAHLGQRRRDGGARGRRLQPRHLRRRGAHLGPIALRDGLRGAARRPGAGGRAPPRGLRGRAARSSCAPGASLVIPAAGPAGRGGQRDAVRDAPAGALRLRAQAPRGGRGQPPLGAARPRRGTFLRLSDNDARLFEQIDGTPLAGRSDRDRRAAPRRARARRGWRGCSPTSASAASSPAWRRARARPRRRRKTPAAAAVHAAREDRSRASGRCSSALYRAGGWVLFTAAGADLHRGADGRRPRRLRLPDRRAATGRRSSSPTTSGSAASCSSPGASSSCACTSARTG